MKKKGLQGFGQVFRFTFRRQAWKPGWILATVLPMVIFLIAIPLIMLLIDRHQEEPVTETPIKAVYVADLTGLPADYAALNQTENEIFRNIEYHYSADTAEALREAGAQENALALEVRWEEDYYALRLIRPEGTALSGGDASNYGYFLTANFTVIGVQKSGIEPAVLAELGPQIYSGASTSEAYREDSDRSEFEVIREVLNMLLPYLCIMLLYFMVLIYGQGIAGAVVLEKSSKLMDTMLLSLRPEAMILGKTLAGAAAGIIQMAAWIIGIAGGCVLGKTLVLAISPNSTMGLLQFFSLLGSASGLFTPSGIILAILLMLCGFLMYCAIASIGGALAPRAEDLGSCNSVFTMLLVVSFLLTFFGETSSSSSMVSDAPWMNFVPFTAVLCTPARILLGKVSIGVCVISVVLTLALALIAIIVAGKLYKLLTFRKGDPPKIKDIPKLLRNGGA